jgi:hypothetical protein
MHKLTNFPGLAFFTGESELVQIFKLPFCRKHATPHHLRKHSVFLINMPLDEGEQQLTNPTAKATSWNFQMYASY